MLYYLSGPMRGFPDLNFPAFQKAVDALRKFDVDVISPHEWGDVNDTRSNLMGEDLRVILEKCDGVICLEGWQLSPGACAEVAVAFATDKPVKELKWDHKGCKMWLAPCPVTKVTVPRELQYRNKIPLVGLCGFARSGKDTVAQHMVSQGWTRVAFADKLRDMLYALNPIIALDTHEVFQMGFEDPVAKVEEGIRLRTIVDNETWDEAKVNHVEIRQLLQRLGTEAGRECVDDNLWVSLAEEKIESAGGPVVVADCRFPNEVQMVRRRGGTLIWIEREGVGAVNAHASEHSIMENDCDYTIWNSGTLETLYESVETILDLQLVGA